jgi:3-oxoacyl-[acyl-carrier protein] reductase
MKPIAVVTGARQGIGQGIALALAEAGFDLLVLDLVEDETAQATVAQLRAAGAQTQFLRADIADVAAADACVQRCWAVHGRVDVLVNNAGVQARPHEYLDVLDATVESFDRVLGINLRGTFFLTQAFARRMVTDAVPEHYRAIVTVSSINALQARTTTPEYCLSKSALSMMNKIFALRMAPYGIGCFEVLPGLIDTAMTAGKHDVLDPIVRGGLSPITRWGQPRDIGQTVAALAQGALPFSTGEAIHVDGGMHMPRSALEPAYMKAMLQRGAN